MYDIHECLGCNSLYKDAPGYMRCGKSGKSLGFYSESSNDGHPGYDRISIEAYESRKSNRKKKGTVNSLAGQKHVKRIPFDEGRRANAPNVSTARGVLPKIFIIFLRWSTSYL